jgi:hypothetical protein
MSNNIHVKYCNSGIIKVIVNTNEKWCSYYVQQELDLSFTVAESIDFSVDRVEHCFSVDFKPDTKYIRINDQEKDQVYIYFIPTDMI